MTDLIRSMAVLFAILVVAMVFALAGEATCGECIHGCCTGNDGVRRLFAAIRRFFQRLTSFANTLTQVIVARASVWHAQIACLTPQMTEVAPLRI